MAAYRVVWGCVVEQWLGVLCMVSTERLVCVVEQWLGVLRRLSTERL